MSAKAKAKKAAPQKMQKDSFDTVGSALQKGTPWLTEGRFLIFAALILCICLFFSFYHLGVHPARDWDEARHGVSAYEMLRQGNYIGNTYQYQPDYYNLKPPLSFYGIMLGYRLFGFNLFGMRFYSAAAFALTAIVLFGFCRFRYGRASALAVLAALTVCAPFFRYHFARHGDADALFGLFCVVSLLAMLLIQEYPWAMPACSFAFSLAFLAKSWHALFVPPIVFLYLLINRLFLRLKPWQWLSFVAAGALPILLWAALRYQYDGVKFFVEMVQVDLLNRSASVLEGHSGGFGFYFRLLFFQTAVTGLFPLVMGLGYLIARLGVLDRNRWLPLSPKLAADLPFWGLWAGVPLLLFSVVKTKIAWYVIPILFPMAVLGALLWAHFWERARKPSAKILLGVLAAAVLLTSGNQTWEQINTYYEDPLQSLMKDSMQELAPTRGEQVCLSIDASQTPYGGTQKYVLMGELLFDWKVFMMNGEQFLADPSTTVIITDEGVEEEPSLLSAGCQIIAEGNGYRIYQKSGK